MRKNEKGSTITYVVVVTMVLLVVIAAAMTISFSYYNRSLVANSKRQSYLSAKAIITEIGNGIINKKSEYLKLIPGADENYRKTITISDFPSEMGVVNTSGIEVNEDYEVDDTGARIEKYILTAYVSVTYGGQTSIVNVDFQQKKSEKDTTKWDFIKYYEGEIQESYNFLIANDMISFVSEIQKWQNEIYKATLENNGKVLEAKNGLAEYLNKNSELSGIVFKGDSPYEASVSRNENLRKYVYNVLQQGGSKVKELDLSEFKLPEDMEKNIKNETYYLHIMFAYGKATPRYIIYASESKDMITNDWTPNFIYIPERKHWYYFPFMEKGKLISKLPFSMADVNGTTAENAENAYQAILNECKAENIAQ